MKDKIDLKEIDEMTRKLESLLEYIETDNERMLVNMKAYVSDSRHFKENGNFIKSFEAIVWAWAIFEICSDLGIFRVNR